MKGFTVLPDQEKQWIDVLKGECEDWELAELEDAALREDAFSRSVTFGTGGIRALMGVGPNRLNRLTVAWATAGLAAHLLESCGSAPRVAIAYDTRIHSKEFALATARALAAAGCSAHIFREPQPTPVLSFAVRRLGCDAGVVITASHNPREYNGYKAYDHAGCQATGAMAHAIAEKMSAIDPFEVPMSDFEEAIASGSVSWISDELVDEYVEAVLSQSSGLDCADLRVSYSPLNGAGFKLARRILLDRGIDCRMVEKQTAPDGNFPTCPKPNPESVEAMRAVCELALSSASDLALANDPDADRIGVAVRHGDDMRLLSGDEVGLLLLDYLCEIGPLQEHPIVVSTIVSTPLLESVAEKRGLELRRTLTGFKYVGEQIGLLEDEGRLDDFLCGIEESCGYLRGSYVRDKDGIVALMLVCEMAAWHKRAGRDLVDALDRLHDRYGHMTSRQVSVRVTTGDVLGGLRTSGTRELAGIEVKRTLDYAGGVAMPGDPTQTLPSSNVLQLDLADGSRVMIRPSGTEPKIKAYCFSAGKSPEEADAKLEALAAAAKELLGA